MLGVAAHVYADTFSHYGFSGVSSRLNKVVNDSFRFHSLQPEIEGYILDKAKQSKAEHPEDSGWLANIKSFLAEGASGALGHGAAYTFPDRPYLVWEFTYQSSGLSSGIRNNPESFLEACENLYMLFVKAGDLNNNLLQLSARKPFEQMKEAVISILRQQKPCEGRIEAWKQAAKEGKLFHNSEEIPVYENWNEEFELYNEDDSSEGILNSPVYKFYQAAAIHRTYALRELLPSHRLVVA